MHFSLTLSEFIQIRYCDIVDIWKTIMTHLLDDAWFLGFLHLLSVLIQGSVPYNILKKLTLEVICL